MYILFNYNNIIKIINFNCLVINQIFIYIYYIKYEIVRKLHVILYCYVSKTVIN